MTPSDVPKVGPAGESPAEFKPEIPATPQPGESTVREVGGRRDGTDPTRFGDWEKGGRCIDF